LKCRAKKLAIDTITDDINLWQFMARGSWLALKQTECEKSHLQTGLEWQLQLTAFDDDVGEIQQVNLKIFTHKITS